MPSDGTCAVFVKVDGKALEEFEVEEKESVHSCWIASEAGKVSC